MKKRKCRLEDITEINFWNSNDMIHLSIIPILVVASLIDIEMIGLEYASVLSSFATFSLLVKFYDWLRIFEKPAFYIVLIA